MLEMKLLGRVFNRLSDCAGVKILKFNFLSRFMLRVVDVAADGDDDDADAENARRS